MYYDGLDISHKIPVNTSTLINRALALVSTLLGSESTDLTTLPIRFPMTNPLHIKQSHVNLLYESTNLPSNTTILLQIHEKNNGSHKRESHYSLLREMDQTDESKLTVQHGPSNGHF